MMIKKAKTLQTILGEEGFILTGSLALKYHELTDNASDIDILLVKPSGDAIAVLDRLQNANPSPKHRPGSPVDYSFYYESVKVDVWLLSDFDEKPILQTEEGVRVSSVRAIIRAKKAIGRPKDWINLMNMSRLIYSPSEFEEVLPTLDRQKEYTAQPKGIKRNEKPVAVKQVIDLDTIKSKVKFLLEERKTERVKELLGVYGVRKVTDLDESEYVEFYTDLKLLS